MILYVYLDLISYANLDLISYNEMLNDLVYIDVSYFTR